MTETAGIALENLRMLVEQVGLSLMSEELTALKPMCDSQDHATVYTKLKVSGGNSVCSLPAVA